MASDEWKTACPGLIVLHVDNHLLVVRKPAGLLSQSDHTGDPDVLSACRQWVKQRFQKPGNVFLGLVHRLDRPVAGVMVLARTSKSASRLSKQIRERTVRKRYLAVVRGVPPPSMELRGTMVKDTRRNVSRIERAEDVGAEGLDGKPAVLRFERLAVAGGVSLLRVDLETGRAHQIRVQLSEAGWPIVGDLKYGGGRPAGGSNATGNGRDRPGARTSHAARRERGQVDGNRNATMDDVASMPALFAESFTLHHPTGGQELTFKARPELKGPWAPFSGVLKGGDG